MIVVCIFFNFCILIINVYANVYFIIKILENHLICLTQFSVISFYYVDWSMRFDRDRFDSNRQRDDKLTKFFVYEVFICVVKNMIWWIQINVDSTQSQYLSCVLCANVLQSFCSLKTRRFVNHMQNEIIFNIHDVHHYWKVKIDVVS